LKLAIYFLLWTLYSYTMHVIAHIRHKRNFLNKLHLAHHRYDYGDSKWPPWHDYFFWFGGWKETLDVWITFTLPIIVLIVFDPVYGVCLFAFHYVYEIFLSRNVLDHNPNLSGKYTKVIPVGQFHLKHHKFYKCNYSFFISIWDYLFGTNDTRVLKHRKAGKAGKAAPAVEQTRREEGMI